MSNRHLYAAIMLAFSLNTGTASALTGSEYFAEFRLNGKNLGNYSVYPCGQEYCIESGIFDKLNMPVKEDKPLSFFREYGTINFDKKRQILTFIPTNPSLFASKKATNKDKPDQIITNKSGWTIKSLDYQAGYANYGNSGDYSFTGTLTGKVWQFDTDYHFTTTGKGNINLQWHDDKGSYITDMQVGKLQQYDFKGASISNEPYSRYQDFGGYTYTIYAPIGTRAELYRGADFIKTFPIDKYPYPLDLDLVYGTNIYKLVLYLPTGDIKEEHIEKTVDSYLIPGGHWQYYAAAGVDPDNLMQYHARLAYGVSSELTLLSESSKDIHSLQAFIRATNQILLNPKLYSDGYGVNAYYYDHINVSLSYENRHNRENLMLVAGLRTFLSPTLQYTDTKQDLTRTTHERLQLFAQYHSLFFNPYADLQNITFNETTTKTQKYGFDSFLLLPQLFKVGVNLESDPENKLTNIEAFLTKVIPSLGEFTFKNIWVNLKADHAEVNANIYSNKYISLTAQGRYNYNNTYSIFVGLTGSITPKGFTAQQQAQRGMIYVRPYMASSEDEPYNKKIVNTTVTLDGVPYTINNSPILISDLVPYKGYTLTVDSEIDAEPVHKLISVTPDRGQITIVDVPFIEVAEIEGQAGKDGLKVSLLDAAGNIFKETSTRFGGYYSFRVPKNVIDKVSVKVNQGNF